MKRPGVVIPTPGWEAVPHCIEHGPSGVEVRAGEYTCKHCEADEEELLIAARRVAQAVLRLNYNVHGKADELLAALIQFAREVRR